MILYIGKKIALEAAGGRELLCKLNYDALQGIYGAETKIFELPSNPLISLKDRINAFRGNIDGVNPRTVEDALKFITKEKIDQVFVDGSNLGEFVAQLKRKAPGVKVTTFFHNVEARFFLGSFNLKRSLHSLGVLIANYLAERKAVRYSDKIICLSERDSRLLKKLYGRNATHIAPMALEDKCPASFLNAPPQPHEGFMLFVGGNFYANREGIAWFVREVAPRVNVRLFIVGRGFEALRQALEVPGKVIVVGAVDNLSDWYSRAQFVIAPIFDGSGMKTKVAEALMYGKKIVGSPEAFSGYEDIQNQAGWVCETPDEFFTAISAAQMEITYAFYPAMRRLYHQHYSMMAAQTTLRQILL